jgi:hypothetical protein
VRTIRNGAATLAACLALTLALAGCTEDGGDQPQGDPTSGRTSEESESPTSAPAADGPEVQHDSYTAHAPAGYAKNAFSNDLLLQFSDEAGIQTVSFGEVDQTAVFDLAALKREDFAQFKGSNEGAKKLDDTEIAGEPAYHFQAKGVAVDSEDVFGLVHDGRMIQVRFSLDGDEAARQAVVDSVFASWEWK